MPTSPMHTIKATVTNAMANLGTPVCFLTNSRHCGFSQECLHLAESTHPKSASTVCCAIESIHRPARTTGEQALPLPFQDRPGFNSALAASIRKANGTPASFITAIRKSRGSL